MSLAKLSLVQRSRIDFGVPSTRQGFTARSSRTGRVRPMASLRAAIPAVNRKLEEMAKTGGLEQALVELGARPAAATLVGVALLCVTIALFYSKRRRSDVIHLPPEVPGLPFVGNLLQMTVERPHRKLTSWCERYGPIYSIKTGQTNQVIVTSPELAREALVTKYSSICNRDLGTNLRILTKNRQMVAMCDYGDRYKMLKRTVVTNLLNQTSQRNFRGLREKYLCSALDNLFDKVGKFPPDSSGEVNARDFMIDVLFRLGVHQVFGRDVESVTVPELGGEVRRPDMYRIFVQDLMKGAVQIDWRDFFPSLQWIPNRKFEDTLNAIDRRRSVLIKALMEQHRLLSASQGERCYCDVLLENESQFTKDELLLAAWEPIIESSDTTLVTSEWALYELASSPKFQEKLYTEIQSVVGNDRMVNEDDLPRLPFLNAVIKETLRKYSPVPILPPRFVREQVELGGYTIPAGYQLIVNIFGIHHDPKRWTNPEAWDPSRFTQQEDGANFDMGVTDMRLMPFGGGKRICAGMTQVFYIVPLIVATLIQHFEWSLPERNGDAKIAAQDTVYLTTQKLEPLQACAKPRVPHRLPSKTLSVASNK